MGAPAAAAAAAEAVSAQPQALLPVAAEARLQGALTGLQPL